MGLVLSKYRDRYIESSFICNWFSFCFIYFLFRICVVHCKSQIFSLSQNCVSKYHLSTHLHFINTRYIKHLQPKQGLIYVANWQHDSFKFEGIYTWIDKNTFNSVICLSNSWIRVLIDTTCVAVYVPPRLSAQI